MNRNQIHKTDPIATHDTKSVLDLARSCIIELENHIERHTKKNGVILSPLSPRLLESVLLAAYDFKYQLKQGKVSSSHNMLNIALNETLKLKMHPHLDITYQLMLLELYKSIRLPMDEFSKDRWILSLNGIIQEMLRGESVHSYIRKLYAFMLTAAFCVTNPCLQESILKHVGTTNLPRKFSETNVKVAWNGIYHALYVLLKAITTESGTTNLENVSRALSLLMAMQSSDGSFQKNHYLTLLVMHALQLVYQKYPHQKIEQCLTKADNYMEQFKSTGLSVVPNLNLFNTVYYHAWKWYFLGKMPSSILITTILDQQLGDGGWPFTNDFPHSDLDTAAFAFIILAAKWFQMKSSDENSTLKKELENAIASSLNFMTAQRLKDGSYTQYAHSKDSLAEMTARAIIMLSLMPPEFITQETRKILIRDAIVSLMKQITTQGLLDYSGYSLSRLYPTGQVALALHVLSHSPCTRLSFQSPNFKQELDSLKKLLIDGLQLFENPDGSYSLFHPPLGMGEFQATFSALITLSCLQQNTPLIPRIIKWLVTNVLRNKSDYSSQGTGPRPLRYLDPIQKPILLHVGFSAALHSKQPKGIQSVKKFLL